MTNKKINDIYESLISHATHENNLGLLSGSAGIAMALFYASQASGESKYRQKADEMLDVLSEKLSDCFVFSHCSGLAGIGLVFIDLLRNNCNKRKKLPKTKIGVDFLTNRQKRRAENSPRNVLNLLIFGVFHSSKIPQNFFVDKMFLEANFV